MTASPSLTRQQQWVYDCLVKNPTHQNAELILRHAHEAGHAISLATIYRALAALRRKGMITSSSLGQNHQHFEPTAKDAHHHFVCSQCGLVIEIQDKAIDRRIDKFLLDHSLVMQHARMLIEGLCPACQQSPSTSPSRKEKPYAHHQ